MAAPSALPCRQLLGGLDLNSGPAAASRQGIPNVAEAASRLPVGSAVRWASLSQVVRQVVQVLTIVLLARSLPPADFGLVTMALVVTGFVALFSDLGVGSAVIQRADAPAEWLSTLFWLAVAAGVVVSVATILAAPVIADIYREPALTDILRVLSLSFAITGVGVVHQAVLERHLRYGAVAKVETTSAIAGSVAALVVAFGGGGVWSLVAMSLVTAALGAILFWIASAWRPGWSFRRHAARSGGSFGAALTTFNVANYVSRNADYFLIGRSFGPEQLGFYTLAYRLMLLPLQSVTSVINRVMFPSLSRLRDDPDRLRRIYLAGVGATAFAAFPICFGLAATAPRLIPTVLGPQWNPAVPVAIILSLVGVLQAVGASVGPVFLATGAVRMFAAWGVLSSAVVLTSFVVGLRWGIVGVASAYLVATVVLVYPSLRISLRPLSLGARDLIAVTWRTMIISLAMAMLVTAASAVIGDRVAGVAVLAIEIGLGVTSYAALSFLANRDQARLVLSQLVHA
jgi:O-antigen/teichoic acid export membrane protein